MTWNGIQCSLNFRVVVDALQYLDGRWQIEIPVADSLRGPRELETQE